MVFNHQRKGGGDACPGVGTEGLRREYHGMGPHRDSSIALSQVWGWTGTRWDGLGGTEAGRGREGPSASSVSEKTP